MPKIETGFTGERFIVLPQPFLDLMADNPFTGDLFIHSLGHIAHAHHHHVFRPSGIGEYVFLYCTWGRGQVKAGNRGYSLAAHQYMILPAGVPHSYRADEHDPWTLYWIIFSGGKSHFFAREMGNPGDAPPSVYSRIEERTALFEEMYAVLCGGFTMEKLNYANILLMHFLGSFLYMDLFRGSPSAVKHVQGMISRVTHYMTENVENSLTLKQIADYAGYSTSYFYRKFIRETGYAPIDYFIHLKINKASIYLIKTSMTVSQIAAKLGFNSADYFSRTFRRMVGITATEFRKQNFRL